MINAITLLARQEQTMELPTDLPLVGWTRDPGPFSGEMRFLPKIGSTRAPHTRGEANQRSKIIGNSAEVDDELISCRASGIPSEACLSRETGMRSLRTGKNHIRWDGPLHRRRRQVHLNTLISHEMLTGTSMFSAALISPEERCGTNSEQEFLMEGFSADTLILRWNGLREQLQQALLSLSPQDLAQEHLHPRRGSIIGLDILIVVARHAAEHLGQAELTRDLALAATPR